MVPRMGPCASVDAAVAVMLLRLSDLYMAINGVRPVAPPDVPPHETMVRWMPILDASGVVRIGDRTVSIRATPRGFLVEIVE